MPAPPGNPSEPLLDGVTAAVPSPKDDMPDSDPHPPHNHAIGELGDRDLARIVLARAFMGLPLAFIVSTALRLTRRPGQRCRRLRAPHPVLGLGRRRSHPVMSALLRAERNR